MPINDQQDNVIESLKGAFSRMSFDLRQAEKNAISMLHNGNPGQAIDVLGKLEHALINEFRSISTLKDRIEKHFP